MAGTYDKCDSEDGSVSSVQSTLKAVILLFLLLTWLPFAVHFCWKLIKTEDHHPLVYAIVAYATSASISLLSAVFWDMVEPILQSYIYGFSLHLCSLFEFLAWISLLTTYITLIEVLILRSDFIFNGSAWELPSKTVRTLRMMNLTNWIVVFVLVSVQCIRINCYTIVKSGVIYDIGMTKNRSYRSCELKESSAVMGILAVSAVTTFSMMIYLGWIFIDRLRKINKTMSDSNTQSIDIIIEKSSISGLASISTYFVNLTLVFILDFDVLIVIDTCLNLIFLYSMFKFGDSVYQHLFGYCIRKWLRDPTKVSINRGSKDHSGRSSRENGIRTRSQLTTHSDNSTGGTSSSDRDSPIPPHSMLQIPNNSASETLSVSVQ